MSKYNQNTCVKIGNIEKMLLELSRQNQNVQEKMVDMDKHLIGWNETPMKHKHEKINFKNFQNFTDTIRGNLYRLPSDIDLIVGIPRSGVIAAYIIALFINKRVCSLNEFINGYTHGNGERPIVDSRQSKIKKVLVVDDSIYSGKALVRTKDRLKSVDLSNIELLYMAVYATEESKHLVDHYFEIVNMPDFFSGTI